MAEYKALYDGLKAAGVGLAAISVDPPERAAPMKAELGLPFPILCDSDRKLITEWGLLNEKEMGGIAFPAVFAIDREMTVRFRSLDKTAARADASQVSAIAKEVMQSGAPANGEVERRKLRPGMLFVRALVNALRRGVRTPRS